MSASAPARAEINRANAAHSTGPRTEEGKSRSSQNATRHGLTSKSVVLPNENAEEYETLRETLLEKYAPVGDYEHALVVVVAETFWRRQRMYRLENAVMTSRMNAILEENADITDGDDALARMFTDPAEMSRARLLLRYLTAAERAYSKAVSELEKVQAERRQHEIEQTWVDSMQEPEEDRGSDKCGFVSQTAPADPAIANELRRLRSLGPLEASSV